MSAPRWCIALRLCTVLADDIPYTFPGAGPLGSGTVAAPDVADSDCAGQALGSAGKANGELPTSGATRLAACTISTWAGCRMRCETTSASSSFGLPLLSVVFVHLVIVRKLLLSHVSQTLSVSRM